LPAPANDALFPAIVGRLDVFERSQPRDRTGQTFQLFPILTDLGGAPKVLEAPALFHVARPQALFELGAPDGGVIDPQLLEMEKQDLWIFGPNHSSLRTRFVPSGIEIGLRDGLGIEYAESVMSHRAGALRHKIDKQSLSSCAGVVGEDLGDHFEADRLDGSDTPFLAALQVIHYAGVIDVFVDVCDDDPIGIATLPDCVSQATLLVDKGVSGDIEMEELNPGVTFENGDRLVRGSIVVNEVPIDEAVVVPEEEG